MDTIEPSKCQITCWSLSALSGALILSATIGVVGGPVGGVIVGLSMALLFTRLVCTGHSADDPGIRPVDVKEMLRNVTGVAVYKAPIDQQGERPAQPEKSAPVAAPRSEVAWLDENLTGFNGRVSRDDRVTQAKTLAADGETEFSRRRAEDDMQ